MAWSLQRARGRCGCCVAFGALDGRALWLLRLILSLYALADLINRLQPIFGPVRCLPCDLFLLSLTSSSDP